MRPILAFFPPLPSAYLWPLSILFVIVGGLLTARNLRAVAQSATENLSTENPSAEKQEEDDPFATWLPLGMALCGVVLLFFWNHNPIKLYSYGVMLIIGFLAATYVACLEARRRGYDPNIIVDLAVPLLLVSVAMCRLLYVALNRDQFHSLADVLRLWDGGLAFHGAIIGGIAVISYFAWSRRIGFWRLADLIAPSVFLGYFFGRIGCFLNGCCYGGVCDLPWAMRFPDEMNRHILTPPSHPAQLYSAFMALPLFFFMQRARLMPRFNRFPGQLTLMFFGLYAIERFIMELFRNGATSHTVFGISWLTEAQGISIFGLMTVAMFWLAFSRRQQRLNAAPPDAQETSLPPTSSGDGHPVAPLS